MDLYDSWKRDIDTYRAIADDMEQALDFSKGNISKRDLLAVFMNVRRSKDRTTTFKKLLEETKYSEEELNSIVKRLKSLGNIYEREDKLIAL